jgi:hypothetical protein
MDNFVNGVRETVWSVVCVNSNLGAHDDEKPRETMRVRVDIKPSIFDAFDRPAESEFSTAKISPNSARYKYGLPSKNSARIIVCAQDP